MKPYLTSAVLAIAAQLALVQGAAAEQYSIGTLPQGSSGYVIASAIAATASDHSDNNFIAVATGGSNLVLPQVEAGEMDFATSNLVEVVYAVNGTGNFAGSALPKLRIAAVLPQYQVGLLVRRDSEFKTAADLAGHTVPTQYSAMKMIELLQEGTLAAEGVDQSSFKGTAVPNFAKAVELLTAGRVDAAYAAPTSAQVREADASVGIRFLSVAPVAGGEEKMREIAPNSYLSTLEPGPGIVGVSEPVTMFSYEYALLVGAHVPDAVVHGLVKAMYENTKQLAESSPYFKGWDPKAIYRPVASAEFHPGALAFFREAGLKKD